MRIQCLLSLVCTSFGAARDFSTRWHLTRAHCRVRVAETRLNALKCCIKCVSLHSFSWIVCSTRRQGSNLAVLRPTTLRASIFFQLLFGWSRRGCWRSSFVVQQPVDSQWYVFVRLRTIVSFVFGKLTDAHINLRDRTRSIY